MHAPELMSRGHSTRLVVVRPKEIASRLALSNTSIIFQNFTQLLTVNTGIDKVGLFCLLVSDVD